MRPDLTVVVIAGDGDVAGIGGNHLIHAARRNINLSVFMVNNMVYGMTGGQVAPTTPVGVKTSTTPHRNVEPPFRMADLVAAAGASYVARWTTYHVFQLKRALQQAMTKRGFSFVEIVSQCPENYGRRIGLTTGVEFLKKLKEQSVLAAKAKTMSEEELQHKIVVGELCNQDRPEFTAQLQALTREQVENFAREEAE